MSFSNGKFANSSMRHRQRDEGGRRARYNPTNEVMMELHPLQVAASLDAVAQRISRAERMFDESMQGNPYGETEAEWHLLIAYAQLLTLAEALGLPLLRADIARDLETGRVEGLLKAQNNPDGNIELKWADPARRYVAALQATFVKEPERTVTKDVESILRAAVYPLCDLGLFGTPPSNEATLHRRLESILRCVFPDLRHKPKITKPIKHFEPDTGIPSIQTLIEYKFLSSPDQVARIAEELLADTRGYLSKEWTSFIYVIYETTRIKPEAEWRLLLRESGITSDTNVVVLCGDDASGAHSPSSLLDD